MTQPQKVYRWKGWSIRQRPNGQWMAEKPGFGCMFVPTIGNVINTILRFETKEDRLRSVEIDSGEVTAERHDCPSCQSLRAEVERLSAPCEGCEPILKSAEANEANYEAHIAELKAENERLNKNHQFLVDCVKARAAERDESQAQLAQAQADAAAMREAIALHRDCDCHFRGPKEWVKCEHCEAIDLALSPSAGSALLAEVQALRAVADAVRHAIEVNKPAMDEWRAGHDEPKRPEFVAIEQALAALDAHREGK